MKHKWLKTLNILRSRQATSAACCYQLGRVSAGLRDCRLWVSLWNCTENVRLGAAPGAPPCFRCFLDESNSKSLRWMGLVVPRTPACAQFIVLCYKTTSMTNHPLHFIIIRRHLICPFAFSTPVDLWSLLLACESPCGKGRGFIWWERLVLLCKRCRTLGHSDHFVRHVF